MTLDPTTFKQAMSQWATGVSIITSHANGQYHGMTASSFSSLSLNPLLILVNIGKQQQTHQFIEQSGIFAVNILNSTQSHLAKVFAGIIPNVTDRFDGLDVTTHTTGAPILPDVMGWVECKVYQAYDGGDHTIFVGEVVDANAAPTGEPLLYYHRQWGEFQPLPTPDTPKSGITHIVMMRLHEPTTANLNLIKESLLALKGKISQILAIEVGLNVVKSDRAYDLALTVQFESLDALNIYQDHPEHVQVVTEIIKPRASSVVAIDYHN